MTDRSYGVLVLSPFFSPNIGGVETHLDDLLCSLDSRGYKVFVQTYSPITTEHVLWKQKEKYGHRSHIRRYRWFGKHLFHRLERYPLLDFLYLTPYLGLRVFLFLLFHRRQIGVIHAQGFNAACIGIVLKKIFHLRLVVSTHAVYEIHPAARTATCIRWILQRADKVLCLSKASLRELVSFGVPSPKLDVFRYWLDRKNFQEFDRKQETRKILGVHDRFTVLFVGRLLEKKGIKVLIEVAKLLPDVQFIFIGVGPLEHVLKQEALQHENILFLGKIPNADLPQYYNMADIFCIPSQYEEGFGRVAMEALACGVPVVASKKGGISEALDESVAILVEPTVDNFKREIQHLCDEPEKCAFLQRNTRHYVMQHFSEKNVDSITRHYQ